jgi:hypothetical protein
MLAITAAGTSGRSTRRINVAGGRCERETPALTDSEAEPRRSAEPVVYGSPAQLAVLLESITRVIEGEPREVFEDATVRYFGRQLSGLIARRVTEVAAR